MKPTRDLDNVLYRGKLCGVIAEYHLGEFPTGWVEGWYCPTPFSSWPLTTAIVPKNKAVKGTFVAHEVDPNTVSEFTGYYDCRGTMVFVGDIVKLSNCDTGELFVIKWVQYKAMYRAESYVRKLNLSDLVGFEVVGNIWDNRDLMEDA